MFENIPHFILGSQSPRRKDIFNMLGLSFKVSPSHYDEDLTAHNIPPVELPKLFSAQKALSLCPSFPKKPILGFDTLVFLEGKALGKPKDSKEALKTLMKLNGKTHQVISAVSLAHGGQIFRSENSLTHVTFGHFSEDSYLSYINTKEPMDKAGSYGIQGKGAQFVEKIEGCFYNVMGVPLQQSLKILQDFAKIK